MTTRLLLILLLSFSAFAQTSQTTSINGIANQTTSGVGPVACVGTPGNTTANYLQSCQASTGAVYACNNSAGCTVAADWVGVPYSSLTGTVPTWNQNTTGTAAGITAKTFSGSGTQLATCTGLSSIAAGDLLQADGSGNCVDSGSTFGAAGVSQGPLGYSSAAITAAAGTTYFPITGGGPANATEANVEWQAPSAGLVANLTVTDSTAVGTGDTIVYTVMQNGAATAITCTLTGTGVGGTKCFDATHSVTAALHDTFSIRAVATGSSFTSSTYQFGVQFGTGGNGSFISSATSPNQNVPSLTFTLHPYIDVQSAAIGPAIPDTNNKSSNATWTSGSGIITLGTANTTPAVGKGVSWHDAGLQGTTATASSCAVASNIATIVAANTWTGLEHVVISGASGACAALNGALLDLSTGTTSGTQFTATFTHANISTTSNSFTVSQTKDLQATILSVQSGTQFTVNVNAADTVSSGTTTTIWWTDNTTALQAAFTAACAVGASGVQQATPNVFLGQGEYHITSTITRNCGNIIGQAGAGGAVIVWDGANNTVPAFNIPSTGQGNFIINGVYFVADSYNFAPQYWIQNQLVEGFDEQQQWTEVQFDNCATACIITNEGANLHMSQFRFQNWCGYGIYITATSGSLQSSQQFYNFTADTGSQFQIQNGCTTTAAFGYDNTAGNATNYAVIDMAGARLEDQTHTPWTNSIASFIRYISGNGGGTTYAIPSTNLRSMTFSFVGSGDSSSGSIISSDDTSGNACPSGTWTGISYKTITKAYQAGSSNYCGGTAIVQPGDMQAGLGIIRNFTWGFGSVVQSLPSVTTTTQTATCSGTCAFTQLSSFLVPAGSLSANGRILVTARIFTPSGNTSNCTYQLRTSNVNAATGGTAASASSPTFATSRTGSLNAEIFSANSFTAQNWWGLWGQGNSNNTQTMTDLNTTGALTTSGNFYVMLTADPGASGDSCSSNLFDVRVIQ